MNRMLKPWANMSMSPSLRFGATNSSYAAFCSVSGSRIMMTSASAAASASDVTRSPASSALRRLVLPSRSATRTSTPDSNRFSAWAWPWEP